MKIGRVIKRRKKIDAPRGTLKPSSNLVEDFGHHYFLVIPEGRRPHELEMEFVEVHHGNGKAQAG